MACKYKVNWKIVFDSNLLKQVFSKRRILAWLIFAAVPALLFYGISIEILTSSGLSVRQIIRDPAQNLNHSSFMGFVSSIGSWVWLSAGIVCLFSASVGGRTTDKKHMELLVLMGIVSVILAVDDFFLLHDRYLPQKAVFLFYAVYTITLLIRYFRTIMEIDGWTFLMAGGLLAASIFTDTSQRKIPLEYMQVQVIEDGFKFVGAVTWFYFNYQLAAYRLTRAADKDGHNESAERHGE